MKKLFTLALRAVAGLLSRLFRVRSQLCVIGSEPNDTSTPFGTRAFNSNVTVFE